MGDVETMSGTPSETPMVLGNCIACGGLMRLPVTTSAQDVAKCPHCEKQFPVQHLLASAIPAAEIVDASANSDPASPHADKVRALDATDDVDKTRTKFEVPKQLYEGARRRRKKSRSKSGSSQRSRKPETWSSTKTFSNRSSVQPAPVAETQNHSQPPSPPQPTHFRGASESDYGLDDDGEESTLLEWIKIAGGGLIAFPLAYLAIMWSVGVDPFSLSSTIESVAPVLVPAKLRSTPKNADSVPPLTSPPSKAADDTNDADDELSGER